MDVWNHSLGRSETVVAGVSKAMCDMVKEMLLAYQKVEKFSSFDLQDPITTVTSKLGEDQVTLQDIALSILSRPIQSNWQRRSAVAEFTEILDLVSQLLKDAAAEDISFSQQFGNAFYDLSVLVFTVLPNEWNEQQQHEAEKFFHIERESAQGNYESKIRETGKDLLALYFGSTRPPLDWEHGLFSIIGMAAAICSETGRESSRLLATEAILRYRDLIVEARNKDERVQDDDWDWLQLAAVWVRHLLKDETLADALVDEVATGRPFSFGMFLSGKHGWGSYGYPNISILGSDFRLQYPRNIGHRLGDTVKQTVKHWEDLLMNSDQLSDTYERIEKIREPIRQKMMERLEKEKKDRALRKPKSKSEPSDTHSELSREENIE
jgi:hypothetical protein